MRKRRYAIVSLAIIYSLSLCCQAAAGKQGSAQNADANPAAHKKKKKLRKVLGLVHTRGVVNADTAPPLTAGGKFNLAVSEFANPFAVVIAPIKAEYYRATDPRAKIGYGISGYGEQVGAAYLDTVDAAMFSTFLYPSLLHQDPRYYRKGEGPFKSRFLYSISRVFITRGDSGQKEVNWSQVLGSATATVISRTYYPPPSRGFGRTTSNLGWSLLGDAGTNLFNEFWPDFARWLNKKL
jgi:hypothetical protein